MFWFSTSPSGCQAQGVRMISRYYAMEARNKYAMVVNKYARMVVAMINDIFGFYMMNARCKSVFVFSDF